MLEVTEEGLKVSEQLWHRPHRGALVEDEMAYLAAVSILEEYPVLDAYDLAQKIPFIHGFEAKHRAVKAWVANGWIERTAGRY